MRKISFFKKIDKLFLLLAVFVSTYISYLIYFTFSKHMNFFSGRYDLGNMDQTVWNTLHGRIFIFTNPELSQNMSRLSTHSDFILILFAPFYLIWQDARMLLLIQTIVIALGAFFIYLIGKKLLSQRLIPLLISVSYLLNPYVNQQNMFDFHSVSLSTTFILAAFYFLLKNNYKVFWIFTIFTLITKEHTFLAMGLFGLYMFLYKKKLWGLFASIISFIIFYLLIAKIMPAARGEPHFALAYYKDFGNSTLEILWTFLTNPVKVFSVMIAHDVFTYLKLLFMPVGYLSIFAPFALIFALPEFLINILSSDQYLRSYYFHYAAVIIPFIYISAMYGIKKILPFCKKFKITWLLYLYIIFSSFYAAWYFGPLPFASKEASYVFQTPKERDVVLNYIKNIPENVPVMATNNIGAHLSHRQELYAPIDSGIDKANILLILRDNNLKEKLLHDSRFYMDYFFGDFSVFKRSKKL